MPTTLAIDIGGTGLKASVLDADGGKIVERVRTETPYPCPPRVLIRELDKLTHKLPPWDRISVGFPGFVRAGRVLTAPNLSTKAGPGTAMSRKLVEAWAGFPLAAELEGRLGKPTRLSNDADMHGLAVIRATGSSWCSRSARASGPRSSSTVRRPRTSSSRSCRSRGAARSRTNSGTRLAAASGTVAGANVSSPRSRCSTCCSHRPALRRRRQREEAHGRSRASRRARRQRRRHPRRDQALGARRNRVIRSGAGEKW